MTIASLSRTTYSPFWQAPIAPVKLIYSLFLKAAGYLLLFFGAKEWAEKLKIKAEKIDSNCTSLLVGLWAYGRRFLVSGDNYEESCRGSCYWLIHQYLSKPDSSLAELAKEFEEEAPREAIYWHKNNLIPANLEEKKIWSETTYRGWPVMPKLDPGIYTFLVGHSKNGNEHGKAHRFVFFRGEENLLFDPNTGLSIWEKGDWKPLLDRIASDIRISPVGYFTLECYSYAQRDSKMGR
jgi:hypothetical protein